MFSCPFLLALGLTMLQSPGASPAEDARPFILEGVRIVDATSDQPRGPTSVLVKGGEILAVAEAFPATIDTRVVNCRGKWLIPGLWDLHTHLVQCGAPSMELYVANGVTGVRDMGGDWETTQAWRKEIEAGKRQGPRILAAGPVLENPAFLDQFEAVAGMLAEDEGAAIRRMARGRLGVGSADQAAAVLDQVKALGVDHVKIRSCASVEVYHAIAAAAKERGLALVGHAPEMVVPPLECAKAGQRSIEHTSFMVGSAMYEPEEIAELVAALKASGTALVPTLIADHSYRLTPDADIRAFIAGESDSPRRRYATAEMLGFWKAQMSLKRFEGPIDWQNIYDNSKAVLVALREAGIPVLPGTDLGVATILPGFGLHDELRLFQSELGMSPHEALSAATLGAAKLVGLDDETGTVEEGKAADLVLLDADPLQDLGALGKIHAVVRAGKHLDRKALDALLEIVAKASDD